jgi:L-idonate 5-dehydrogenase
MDDGLATMMEPFSVALHAIKRVGDVSGKSALVMGGGTIGLLVAIALRAFGSVPLAVCDIVPARRSKAIELGADAALDPAATDLPDQVKSLTGNGFDLVFEASGAKAALRAAFDLVRPGGTIVQIGTLGTEDISLPANQLMNREINYIGSMRYGDVFGEAIQLAASGRVNLQPIISSVLPFGKFVQGLHLAADKSNSFKVQIEL